MKPTNPESSFSSNRPLPTFDPTFPFRTSWTPPNTPLSRVCLRPTFGGRQGLVVEGAPAHRVQLRRHHVAPEVGLALVAVAAEAQQQQLPAGGDDGGHPVGVRAAAVGHLQLHPGLEAALQAGLHLHATQLCWCFRRRGYAQVALSKREEGDKPSLS